MDIIFALLALLFYVGVIAGPFIVIIWCIKFIFAPWRKERFRDYSVGEMQRELRDIHARICVLEERSKLL